MKTAILLDTKELDNTIITDNEVRFSFQYSTYTWNKNRVRALMDDLILIMGQLEDKQPEKKETEEPINLDNVPF